MFIVVSHEDLIGLIRDYVYDNILPNYSYLTRKGGYFQRESYALWASEELISYISQQKTEPPIEALKAFAWKMETFAERSTKGKQAFEIARDLSFNILDICRGAGWLD